MNRPATAARFSRAELLAVFGALAGAIVVLVRVGRPLWTRPFWLDERCCTLFNVSEARNAFEVVANVARGDVAPPLLHLIVWTVTRVTGFSTPAVRSIALVTVCLAAIFVYAALRRRFGRMASAAGVAAVAPHELILEHAFEIRFYGAWVLFAAAYAWALGLDQDRARSRRRDIAVAVCSILVCTIHWFGVISLGLMAIGAIASQRPRWREGVRLVAPSVVGLLVLAACAPLLFVQLKAGGESLYWIPPLNLQQVKFMAEVFVVRVAPGLAVMILLADRLRATPQARPQAVLLDPSLAALSALILMPIALFVISVLVKPVVWARYAIVALLAWSPIVALAVDSLGRILRGAVLALLVVMAFYLVGRLAGFVRNYSTTIGTYTRLFHEAKRANMPLVFQSYHLMYPVDGNSRRQSRARFLELSDSSIAALEKTSDQQRKVLIRDRNMVRVHERAFGFPVPLPQAQLDTTAHFLLFGADETLPAGYQDAIAFGKAVFPRHKAVRVHQLVTRFDRLD